MGDGSVFRENCFGFNLIENLEEILYCPWNLSFSLKLELVLMKAETPFCSITRLLTTEIPKATVSWVLSPGKGQKPVSKDPSITA